MGLFDPSWKKNADKAEKAAQTDSLKTLGAIVRECPFPRARAIAYWELGVLFRNNADGVFEILAEMLEKAQTPHDRCMAAWAVIKKAERYPQSYKGQGIVSRSRNVLKKYAREAVETRLELNFRPGDTITDAYSRERKPLKEEADGRYLLEYLDSEEEICALARRAGGDMLRYAVERCLKSAVPLLEIACDTEDAGLAKTALSRVRVESGTFERMEHAAEKARTEDARTAARQMLVWADTVKYMEKYMAAVPEAERAALLQRFTDRDEQALLRMLTKDAYAVKRRLIELLPRKYAGLYIELLDSRQRREFMEQGVFTDEQILKLAAHSSFEAWDTALNALRNGASAAKLIELYILGGNRYNGVIVRGDYARREAARREWYNKALPRLDEEGFCCFFTGDFKENVCIAGIGKDLLVKRKEAFSQDSYVRLVTQGPHSQACDAFFEAAVRQLDAEHAKLCLRTLLNSAADGDAGRLLDTLANKCEDPELMVEAVLEMRVKADGLMERLIRENPQTVLKKILDRFRKGKQDLSAVHMLSELSGDPGMTADYIANYLRIGAQEDYSHFGVPVNIVIWALKALAAAPDNEAYLPLITPYTAKYSVLEVAVRALIDNGKVKEYCDPACVPLLVSIMKNGPDYDCRSAAELLTTLYRRGYFTAEIRANTGGSYKRQHTDYEENQCNYHADIPGVEFSI